MLVQITINPESRVQAARGAAAVSLQQGGYTPVLLKIVNDSTVTKALRISSPQAGPILSDFTPDKDRLASAPAADEVGAFNRNSRPTGTCASYCSPAGTSSGTGS